MAVVAAAGAFDGLVPVLLHGAPEAAGSTSSFDWRFAAASALVVGSVGALLYWYYGQGTAVE